MSEEKKIVAGGAAPGERAGPMYGAAVPPPASSTMHPPVDYSMATVSLPIPPYDYGSVVNGPTTEMFMMGHQGRFCFLIEFIIRPKGITDAGPLLLGKSFRK